jgi:hypothetical protein
MKYAKYLLLLAAAVIFSIKGYSQTVDEIISKYIDAAGGIQNINSLQTLKVTAKLSGGTMDIPFIQQIKKPGKIRTDMFIQGMTMKRGYDGSQGWQLNPFQGAKEAEKMNESRTREMKKMSDIEGALVNYRDKGYRAELTGKDEFEGSDVYKIKLTDSDGDVTYYYIDTDSYLILKKEAKIKFGEKEVNTVTTYGAYKKVGGVMLPYSIETKTAGDETRMLIEKYEPNAPIDDSVFIMPGVQP